MKLLLQNLTTSFTDHLKAKACLRLLMIYVKNVVENPSDEKYRRIRTTNPKFDSLIWCHQEARSFIYAIGFEQDGEMLVLPTNIVLSEAYNLLQEELFKFDNENAEHYGAVRNDNISIGEVRKAPHLKLATSSNTGNSIFGMEHKPDMTLLSYLVEMGYAEDMAIKALIKTGNKGVQPAMDWIEENLDELLLSQQGENQQLPVGERHASHLEHGEVSATSDTTTLTAPISRYQKVAHQRHKYQEKQRQGAIAAAREAKRAEKKHREYLLKNLHVERNVANEKFEQQQLARTDSSSAANTGELQEHRVDVSHRIEGSAETTLHPNTSAKVNAKVKVHLIGEKEYNIEMELSAKVAELYRKVAEAVSLPVDSFVLSTPAPPSDLFDFSATVQAAGLYPSTTLMMRLKKSEINPFQPQEESS